MKKSQWKSIVMETSSFTKVYTQVLSPNITIVEEVIGNNLLFLSPGPSTTVECAYFSNRLADSDKKLA